MSRATVSNAYNRPDQLSPALRERILSAAADLGYAGPDPAARSLRRGHVGAIGYILADELSYAFSDPAALAQLDGLAKVLEPEGTGLLMLPGVDGGGPSPERVHAAVVDGFVVGGLHDDDPALDAARARGLPLVLLDQPGHRSEAVVRVDDPGGAEAAARHLVELGHRRIGVVSFELRRDRRAGLVDAERLAGLTQSVVRERLAGYRAAITTAGLDWSAMPIWECPYNGCQPGREAIAALMDLRPRPTAILAMSDELAIGVLHEAHDRGLDVPRELSVVGFDDTEEAAVESPALTTVHQPLRRKGELVGRRLLDLQAGNPIPRPRRLPTDLVVRSSTARPRRR